MLRCVLEPAESDGLFCSAPLGHVWCSAHIILHRRNKKRSPNVIRFVEKMSEHGLDGCLKLADCLSASLLLPYRSSPDITSKKRRGLGSESRACKSVTLQRRKSSMDGFTCWPRLKLQGGCGRPLWGGVGCDVVLVLGSWWFSSHWMMSAAVGELSDGSCVTKVASVATVSLSRTSPCWLHWLKPRQSLAIGWGSVRDAVRGSV